MAPDLVAGAAEVALDLTVAEARPTAIRSKAAVICDGPGALVRDPVEIGPEL